MNTFGDQLLKGAAGLEFAGELIDLPDIEGPAAPDSTAPARSSSSAWDDEVTWCTQDDAVHSIAEGSGVGMTLSRPHDFRCAASVDLPSILLTKHHCWTCAFFAATSPL